MIEDSLNNNPGCLNSILRLFGIHSPSGSLSNIQPLPYRIRDDFLSPAEKAFYYILWYIVGKQAAICTKVSLNDLFFVIRPNENQAYRNKIAYKHVDFLLCDPKSMKPVVGIELDDSSHSSPKQEKRDEFVERVFEVAGLPLLRVPVQASYNTQALSDRITPYLKKTTEEKITSPVDASQSPISAAAVPLCPKCGVPMVLRTVTKGDHKGKQFYGCPNYPKCREVKPFNGVNN